jgi:ribosomal protein S18 acetylase RimI-like enzyme
VRKLSLAALPRHRPRRQALTEHFRSGALNRRLPTANVAPSRWSLAKRARKEMTDHPRGADSPMGTITSSAPLPDDPIKDDAEILRDAVREAIRTSPDSFLKTLEDVEAKALDYWQDEIRSSTWAVAQRAGEVVGVAAAKYPDPDKDKENKETARYIESVWIHPDLRGNRLGASLIKYLLEAEYQKHQQVKQFLLWVFPTNSSAISLYKYMGFKLTDEENTDSIRPEIKYRLEFNGEVDAAVLLAVNEVTRRQDQRQHEVTYRVLKPKDSR